MSSYLVSSSWRSTVSGSYDISEMKKEMASVMLETMILNAPLGSTEVLVASGIGVFLGTEEVRGKFSVGYVAERLRQWI